MDRRQFLQYSGTVGALTLAGCTTETTESTPANATDGSDGATATTTPTATPTETATRVIASTVTTAESSCESGDPPAANVTVSDATVSFSGTIAAPTPCYEVVIDSTTYDEGADVLTIALGVESTDGMCIECVGSLVFEGSVSFEGDAPERVVLSGDDGAIHDTSEDTTHRESPTLATTSFEVVATDSGTASASPSVCIERDPKAVVVTGTITGNNGCVTAALETVAYNADTDRLTLDVVTKRRAGTEGQACTQQLVGIAYEARCTFEDALPSAVAVTHDGADVRNVTVGRATAGGSEA